MEKKIVGRVRELLDSMGNRVDLVAVTKTFPVEFVSEAIEGGVKNIGESKIQEALPKFSQLGSRLNGIKKHFIGHLQSNKAKKAVENFDLIHSLDNLNLASVINTHSVYLQKNQECLIQVKVSNESTKTGIDPRKVLDFYMGTLDFSNIKIKGLMIITPIVANAEAARPFFKLGFEIFSNLKSRAKAGFDILSMGMSGDYKIAIEEGSNMVRIGSAIFGQRDYASE
jgi:pyridoxal phosphate enzyme (YggS family)